MFKSLSSEADILKHKNTILQNQKQEKKFTEKEDHDDEPEKLKSKQEMWISYDKTTTSAFINVRLKNGEIWRAALTKKV